MTSEGLAAFVLSDEGAAYRDVCRLYGLDPGRPVEAFDDVLAFDFRMALMFIPEREKEAPIPTTPQEAAQIETDLERQLKAIIG